MEAGRRGAKAKKDAPPLVCGGGSQTSLGSSCASSSSSSSDADFQSTQEEDASNSPRKRRRSQGASAKECCICLSATTNFGDHQICCTPCGHLFGYTCLRKAVTNAGTRNKCPTCRQKCRPKDIRLIADASVMSEDTARIAALQQEVLKLRTRKELLSSQLTTAAANNAFLQDQLAESRGHLARLRDRLRAECRRGVCVRCGALKGRFDGDGDRDSGGGCSGPVPGSSSSSSSAAAGAGAGAPSEATSHSKLLVSQDTHGAARICAFAPDGAWLFVAVGLAGSSHGVMCLSTLPDGQTSCYTLHTKPIFDMDVRYGDDAADYLLLTASSDRTICVSSANARALVGRYNIGAHVWSCAWHPANASLFLAGVAGAVRIYGTSAATVEVLVPLGEWKLGVLAPVHSLSVGGGGGGGGGGGAIFALAHGSAPLHRCALGGDGDGFSSAAAAADTIPAPSGGKFVHVRVAGDDIVAAAADGKVWHFAVGGGDEGRLLHDTGAGRARVDVCRRADTGGLVAVASHGANKCTVVVPFADAAQPVQLRPHMRPPKDCRIVFSQRLQRWLVASLDASRAFIFTLSAQLQPIGVSDF